jgi:hypothetical protein
MTQVISRSRMLAVMAALAALAALLSCRHAVFQSDYRDRLSAVLSVTAPDTVEVGASFQVQIDTSGNNGCWRKGRDEVSRPGPLEAHIAPFDREYIGTGFCAQNLPTFHHVVELTASTKGTIEVFVARRLRAASGADSTGVIQVNVHAR